MRLKLVSSPDELEQIMRFPSSWTERPRISPNIVPALVLSRFLASSAYVNR
jgi:hypothetical protein